MLAVYLMTWKILLFACALALPLAAAESDALAISANIQARHMPHGTILDPVFASPSSDQIVSYTRCGDSATWTGHYLAAEAFRYKVTHTPDALANVKRALAGIASLVDVTGTNVLARCLVPLDSPYAAAITQEESHNRIYTNSKSGYYWVGNTSRDQYSGAFFGLAVAYDLVDDAGVQSTIKTLITLMLDFVRGHAWTVVMPDGSISTTFIDRPDQQLTLLQIGRHINPDRYSTAYDVEKVLLSAGVIVPIGVETLDDVSYFKFNLDYINFYHLVRLESSSFKTVYKKAYDVLRNHTAGHQNAFFDAIDRALNSPESGRDAETVALLDAWLERPRRDPYVDLRSVYGCGNSDTACKPVPVPQRAPTDFIWQRSPFQLVGGGYGTIEGAGIDYILPYWMTRYYAIQSSLLVRSAASGAAVVSPESIASAYGSGLAGATQSATTQPLPVTLAGIGVQVTDSAGATRPAPLFYASPSQVNFEIPKGTATGEATVTVVNGASSLSGKVTVQNVAPALFSASADGKGVAAALAVRVGVNGRQSVTPIFQCADDSGCVAIPIELGVDTPVYLSLYGTGIRNSLANVSCTIGGTPVPVRYAGAQGGFAGLDQVNVLIVLSLRGKGETDLALTVDGQMANTVRVSIQ